MESSVFDTSGGYSTSSLYVDRSTSFNLNSDGIISDELKSLLQGVLLLWLSAPLALLGCIANIVNAVVFVKQGLKDCVSICLFALAMSDLGSVSTGLICNILTINKQVGIYSVIDFNSLIFHFSYICALCYDISQAIIAFISLERCLCVILPLKFKNIFTFKRALVVVVLLYTIHTLAFVPHFMSSGLVEVWDPVTNSTKLYLWLSENRAEVTSFMLLFVHIIMVTIYQIIVVVSTYVMIRGLRKSLKFRMKEINSGSEKKSKTKRQKSAKDTQHYARFDQTESSKNTSSDKGKGHNPNAVKDSEGRDGNSGVSNKNRFVIKTVTTLALVAIVCNTARIITGYAQRIVPDLAAGKRYQNTLDVMNMAVFLFQTVNCMANFIVYYRLNPTFRKTFQATFYRCSKKPE